MSEKIFSIPSELKVKNVLAEGAVEVLERTEKEKEDLSTQELQLDGSNKIRFPGYPYIFEALGEKIIVSIDVFKSGYECKVCKGKKRTKSVCECERNEHPGLRYSIEEIDIVRSSISDEIARARSQMACPECKGDYVAARHDSICPSCKGIGAVLVLPDTSKNLPTTGVVVSMGSQCNKEKLGYGIGDRILFGPYAGSMIPTKAGILFKILDAANAWCVIEGAEEMGQFDFILQDSE
jgi:co-chaperonin GroES (HSP10)